MCPGLLAIIGTSALRTVRFFHPSVKEFLISSRLAKAGDRSSRRYHVDMTRAHTTVAEACLRILLSLNDEASGDHLKNFLSLPMLRSIGWTMSSSIAYREISEVESSFSLTRANHIFQSGPPCTLQMGACHHIHNQKAPHRAGKLPYIMRPHITSRS